MNEGVLFTKKTKLHFWVGVSLGVWISTFLIVIAPFDIATVSLKNRLSMMPGYGILFMLTYFLLISFTTYFPRIIPRKDWKQELFVTLFMFGVPLAPVYLYYISDFIQGEYSLIDFFIQIYLPFFSLILPLLLVLRWVIKNLFENKKKQVILGKNKYDKMVIPFSDLLFVKASDNYIEVHYLESQQLKKKLIRYTLKEVKEDIPELIQTHRSYLINPTHFISWNNKNSISITLSQIPVSNSFRNLIPDLR